MKWGFIGTGFIAQKMADALHTLGNHSVAAALTRSLPGACEFAKKNSVKKIYNHIDEFLADPDVEIIYVATPHNLHVDGVTASLEKGKPVLCEKPMGLNTAQTEKMIALARSKKIFLMEAMWTHFFPVWEKVREILSSGELGEIRLVEGKFCFASTLGLQGRHLNKELAGGALLDVGIYPIYAAQMIYNEFPSQITGSARISSTGVDEINSMIFTYPSGGIASLSSSVTIDAPVDAYIYGTRGYIHIPVFFQPDRLFVVKEGKEKKIEFDRLGNGYTYEVLEVERCLKNGLTESQLITHQRSLDVARIMDELRRQWGVIYPGE
jgi:predicted dehydrogenase